MTVFEATKLTEGEKVWLVQINLDSFSVKEACRKATFDPYEILLQTSSYVIFDYDQIETNEDFTLAKGLEITLTSKPTVGVLIEDLEPPDDPLVKQIVNDALIVKYVPETDTIEKLIEKIRHRILEMDSKKITSKAVFYFDCDGLPNQIHRLHRDGVHITGTDDDGRTHTIRCDQLSEELLHKNYYYLCPNDSGVARELRLQAKLHHEFGLRQILRIESFYPENEHFLLTPEQFYNYINSLYQDPSLLERAGSAAIQALLLPEN